MSHFFPDSSYEDYIQENILRPLGMSSTGFNYSLVRLGLCVCVLCRKFRFPVKESSETTWGTL